MRRKLNKRPVLIAIMQWFITTAFQVDRLFFSYSEETTKLIVVKGLYLFFLIVAWNFGFYAVGKIKSGDEQYNRGFHVFRVYLAINMCLMLILWPGTWAWDDLWHLNTISKYSSWNAWQHILTGIYDDILLQILPFPAGIILLQNIIISLCVAYVVVMLEQTFHIGCMKYGLLDILIKIVPFLLPPVLVYQFSGFRIGLHMYLELVMVVFLCSMKVKPGEWSWIYLIFWSFLLVIVSVWRTECIIYVPFLILLISCLGKTILPIHKKIACLVLILAGCGAINGYQNAQSDSSEYKISATAATSVMLVRAADRNDDADILSEIDKVINVAMIYADPERLSQSFFGHDGFVRDGFSEEDYKAYTHAMVKLAMKYPKDVIVGRLQIFIDASGITGKASEIAWQAENLFEEDFENAAADTMMSHGWFATSPVLKNFRKHFIMLLRCEKSKVWRRIVWNSIIPMVALILGWLKLLVQKKWFLFFVCSAVLTHVLIYILTEPATFFMYSLSTYLFGYVFLLFSFLEHWNNRQRKNAG